MKRQMKRWKTRMEEYRSALRSDIRFYSMQLGLEETNVRGWDTPKLEALATSLRIKFSVTTS